MAVTCPRCSADNSDSRRFCGGCGTQLLASSRVPIPSLSKAGVDTESRFMNVTAALSRIKQSNVAVHVIRSDTQVQTKPVPREYRRVLGKTEDNATACDEANRCLQNLSSGSGGRLFHAETIPSLNEAFREIAQELRRQYTLYYYPSDPKNDSAYHRIRVTADREDATIRARSGYRRIAIR